MRQEIEIYDSWITSQPGLESPDRDLTDWSTQTPRFNTFNKNINSEAYKRRTFFYAEFREAVQYQNVSYKRSNLNDLFAY